MANNSGVAFSLLFSIFTTFANFTYALPPCTRCKLMRWHIVLYSANVCLLVKRTDVCSVPLLKCNTLCQSSTIAVKNESNFTPNLVAAELILVSP